MRCTELTLMPTTLAIAEAVQCVVSPGGGPSVGATPCSVISDAKGGMRDGRVLSRNSPPTPFCMNRSCQRHAAVSVTPASRTISAVP